MYHLLYVVTCVDTTSLGGERGRCYRKAFMLCYIKEMSLFF